MAEYASLAAGLVAILSVWPQFEKVFKGVNRPVRAKAPRAPSTHLPVPHGKGYWCRRCLRAITPVTTTQCANPNPTLVSLLRGGGGARHKLHWARLVETDVPLIFCVACGGIACVRAGTRLLSDCDPP
eukprot:4666245-Pyramimonas_sp.AAC.1